MKGRKQPYDTDAMILRKGVVSARTGERLLIPINIGMGSLICTGRSGNWTRPAVEAGAQFAQ